MSVQITGSAYVHAMERDPADLEYRRSFQALALNLSPSRGRLFDFGCGPGLDAKAYAEAGRTVSVFDVDSGMRDYLLQHCEAEISSGAVRLLAGTYDDFLRTRTNEDGRIDLVVANFAPLNLVTDMPPLFERLAGLLVPRGKLLASVLNPWFRGLWRNPKWWPRLPSLLVAGQYTTHLHGVVPVIRRLPGLLARQAQRHFLLESIYAADPVKCIAPRPVTFRSLNDWPRIFATQFLFLEFTRREDLR